MTEQKNDVRVERMKQMNETFRSFTPVEQQAVTNFFNLHNAAHFIYELQSDEVKEYISACIELSQEVDAIEKEND